MELIELDINQLSAQQRAILMNQLRDAEIRELHKDVDFVKNDIKLLNSKFEIMQQSIDNQERIIQEQKEITNVIGFGKNSWMMGKVFSSNKNRVRRLFSDDITSDEYTLFSRSLYMKINHDCAKTFNVSKIGNIPVCYYEQALTFADTWCPNDSYIFSKLQEFIELRDLGKLREDKCVALKRYLEKYNESINPFRR